MLNKIIDGISIKINELFGDDYYIYSEEIEQGFKEPCFFISLLKPSSTPRLGTRTYREYNFDIHYFPKISNEKNYDMYDTNEKLIDGIDEVDGLEYISVDGGLIRGSKIHSEIIDNVLHFFIKYSLFVIKEDVETEKMESLILKQNIKG
ncbi:MAG: phage tail terminator family protein [Paraclostridium sp.]